MVSLPLPFPLFQLPEEQRLLKDDTPLEDAKSLAEYRIENDDVLALTYKLPGKSSARASGVWPDLRTPKQDKKKKVF